MLIRDLHDLADLEAAAALLSEIWGWSPAETHLLRALEHSGNYVAGAFADKELIAVSAGLLGWRDGRLLMHSHVTGVRPGRQQSGVGLVLKEHQWEWARQRGMAFIEWTFDPLVRRNAWFNLGKLGARAVDYLQAFYGTMRDEVNAGDDSDRLLARWGVVDPAPALPDEGSEERVIDVPHDIVALRRAQPDAARAWRLRTRDDLGGAMAAGWVVAGFDRARGYVLRRAS